MIRVVYNGETHSPHMCSSPGILVAGKEYHVRYEATHNDQQVYTLDEVNGFFYKGWFVPIENIPISLAFSKQIPEVGKTFQCRSVILEHGTLRFSHASVSAKAQVVEQLGRDTYKVMTHGRLYILTVVEQSDR